MDLLRQKYSRYDTPYEDEDGMFDANTSGTFLKGSTYSTERAMGGMGGVEGGLGDVADTGGKGGKGGKGEGRDMGETRGNVRNAYETTNTSSTYSSTNYNNPNTNSDAYPYGNRTVIPSVKQKCSIDDSDTDEEYIRVSERYEGKYDATTNDRHYNRDQGHQGNQGNQYDSDYQNDRPKHSDSYPKGDDYPKHRGSGDDYPKYDQGPSGDDYPKYRGSRGDDFTSEYRGPSVSVLDSYMREIYINK